MDCRSRDRSRPLPSWCSRLALLGGSSKLRSPAPWLNSFPRSSPTCSGTCCIRARIREYNEETVLIDVARIDHWAASGTGPFHRASTFSKILFLLLVVGGAVTAKSPYPLMTAYAVILVVVSSSRL